MILTTEKTRASYYIDFSQKPHSAIQLLHYLSRAPMKVFVIDNSPEIRKRMTKYFATLENVEVVGEADDTVGIIDRIRKTKPDVVTLDIGLPNGINIYVIHKLKQFKEPPKVVVLTDYPMLKDVSLQGGADYFFDKSQEFEKISDVFREMRKRKNL